MRPFIVSPAAALDLDAILSWTHEHFGERARLRYEALIIQGIRDIVDDPHRAGSQQRSEIGDSVRIYHLLHSRKRARIGAGHVKTPRHFLLFRIRTDGTIEIARVLHDSVDIVRHAPDGLSN